MHAHQVYSCVLAVVLVAGTFAAPLQEKQAKEKKDVSENTPAVDKAADQEAELEKLVALAGAESKANNVAVHKSQVSHVENHNGKEVKTEKTEQKVTDTNTGKVLADVTQEVSETNDDETGEPHQIAETHVDIPDKGVHETFVKEEVDDADTDADEESLPSRDSIEFSPTAVAEYLLKSWDFDNFYAALKDLVGSSIMSEEEAERYEEQVISEYQRLLAAQNAEANNYPNEEPLQGYYPAYDEAEKRSNMAPLADQIPDDLYSLDRAYENYIGNDLDAERQAVVEDALSEGDESLTGVIDALLNAWWEKDFEGGNARAQALVSYLYDMVSRDGNPDDIGQIRDILADMLANALLDDVQNPEAQYNIEQAVENSQPSPAAESSQVEEKQEEAEETPEETPDETEQELEETAQAKDTAETAETDTAEKTKEDGEVKEEEKEKKEQKQ
ncbi:enolase-phosphatase E1-like [Haliotis asinina]|uniref:enolase-phosphatase E1-like n=1 Tax=Haliotis asinina TaxID=109174 RepID=UPI003531F4D8